jgi:hypothetical protein
MARKILKKKLFIDSDSAIYACCFITVKRVHFAIMNGKVIGTFKDKNKYNKWFKEQSPIDQACIDHDFTEDNLPFHEARKAFDGWITTLQKLAGTQNKTLLLTKGGTCFRTYRAMLRKYKGNRDNLVHPPYYHELREYLVTKYKALTYSKFEADDMCCMAMEKANASGEYQAILAAIDKDLEQQEGRHINPNKKAQGVYVVDNFTGQYSFYKQMLMGDVADNIPGLDRVGEKSAEKLLDGCQSVHDLFIATFNHYKKKLGDGFLCTPWWWDESVKNERFFDPEYADFALAEQKRKDYPDKTVQMTVEDVFYENADLLYMLRTPDDQYVAPVNKKDTFKVREPYPKGIVIAMLGEDR